MARTFNDNTQYMGPYIGKNGEPDNLVEVVKGAVLNDEPCPCMLCRENRALVRLSPAELIAQWRPHEARPAQPSPREIWQKIQARKNSRIEVLA